MMKINWWPRIPDDMFTNSYTPNLRRVKVDAQQSSFEANTQFRFFDDLSGGNSIATTEVLIYRLTTTNPVNIQSRSITGWAGGRKYEVYPDDGNETITGGTFTDVTDHVFSMNGNLQDSGLPSHPVSQVTIEKRIATDFTSTSKPRTGVAYKSDSNTTRAVDSYSPDSSRAGVAAGSSFFLVFFNIAQNDASEFLFTLEWEEVFS